MLNAVKTKGRVRILKSLLYKSHMLYIRMIGTDYFEYLVEFNGEIYSSYMIITPKEGNKKLSKKEIIGCVGLIQMGAEATLDTLLGHTNVDEKIEKVVEAIEKSDQIVNKEQIKCQKKLTI